METYKASLDKTSKILTSIVFLIILPGIIVSLIFTPWDSGMLESVVLLILVIFAYLFKVQSYVITDQKIIITRPFSILNKEIFLSEIESVSIPNKADFNSTIRTFGNGGLFGYYGWFRNKKLGSFRMYATNKTNRVLIILKDNKGKIVISPDDAGMADALKKHIGKPL